MAVPLTLETVRAAPKVLLHDHLDGGLRPRCHVQNVVANAFGLGWADLEQIAVNGAEAAFAPFEQRRHLVDDVIRPAYREHQRP